MSLDEAEYLSLELADRLRTHVLSDLDDNLVIVVGIANGALMIAKIVADKLSAPLEIISIRRQGSRVKRALGRFRPLVYMVSKALNVPIVGPVLIGIIDRMDSLETNESAETLVQKETVFTGKHVVLIDDCIESGQTIFFAKKMLAKAGAKTVTTGVITLKNLGNDPKKPIQYSPIVYLNTRIQHFPWSQNSTHYDKFLSWLKMHNITPWL